MDPLFARCSVRQSTPGPGAYDTRGSLGGPRWTMKGRHSRDTAPTNAPYRSLPSTVGSGPKISLSSRHNTRDGDVTPGPSYVPPGIGSGARKTALSGRHAPLRSSMDTPGPGAYNVRPMFANDAKKSTLHGRTRGPEEGTASPGPAAYSPNVNATKPRAPAATMHVRTKLPGPESTPGYYNIGSTLRGPKFTIGHRETLDLVPI